MSSGHRMCVGGGVGRTDLKQLYTGFRPLLRGDVSGGPSALILDGRVRATAKQQHPDITTT